jgi:hypothetical protein
VLMDEPIASLDRARRDEILPFLDRLHAALRGHPPLRLLAGHGTWPDRCFRCDTGGAAACRPALA